MHDVPLKEFYRQLGVDPRSGLSANEAARRLHDEGANVLRAHKREPEALKFLRHLTNLFALLLWVGAGLSFVADAILPGQGNAYIGFALASVVLLNGAFSYYQEREAERIMAGFRSLLPARSRVLRGGRFLEIPAAQLVPGDVIALDEGDRVPADARLFEVVGLKVNNASLTGESEPQLRTTHPTDRHLLDSRNVVFSGTAVEAGRGRAVVFATGMNTQMGRTAELTQRLITRPTPLRRELDRFIRIISAIAVAMGLAVFLVSLLWINNPIWTKLMFAIGIIVANVPEGMLATVTLCLAIAARRMAEKKALVRNLESVETLGSTTVICTDKTGTLTQNRMQVTRLFLNDCIHTEADAQLEHAELDKLLMVATLCNNALPARENGGRFLGDPTESALLEYAQRYHDVMAFRNRHARLFELPFSAKTKVMATIQKVDEAQVACLKGAPELVLTWCDRILINGEIQPLTEAHRADYMQAYNQFARRAERVLLFAYREVAPRTSWSERQLPRSGYIFVGLVSLFDPPRPEVPTAVATIRAAGVKIIMVTGDYHVTAEALGRLIGLIATPFPTIITGERLRAMSDARLDWALRSEEIVFARISPEQKLRIVEALQRGRHVVAMTGDGVNDAPALKRADIGVAMGRSGVDVAREAANVVLLDDNFATLVPAIREGRTMFDNLKKSITYVLTHSMPEVLPFLAFILFGLPLPLTVPLILAIDLGTDMLPGIALGSEKSETDVMLRPPRPYGDHLVNVHLLVRAFALLGIIEAAAGFYAYFSVLHAGGWQWGQFLGADATLYRQAVSAFFAAIVLCQIANGLASKVARQSLRSQGVFDNRLLLLAIMVEVVLVYAITQTDMLHPFFGTASLSPAQLLLGWPFAIAIIVFEETRRYFLRQRYAGA